MNPPSPPPPPTAVDRGERARPEVVLVMGVSGSGKSTIGQRLAESLGWPFADGDDFHPPANVAKMRARQPLDDHDRRPWLKALREFIVAMHRAGSSCVVACSALKAGYRDVLLPRDCRATLVYLKGTRAQLHERLSTRQGHFMPAALLDSQLATLEEPDPREAVVCDISESPDVIVNRIRHELGR